MLAEGPAGKAVVMRRTLQVAVAVFVVALWVLYLRRNWDELSRYAWRFSPACGAVAVAAGLGYWTSLAWCWQRTHRAVGGRLGLRQGLRIWSVSTFARYVPGNVWHAFGRVYLGERAGERRLDLLVSFTLEQILTLLGALATFVLLMPFQAEGWQRLGGLLAVLPLGLVVLHPAVFQRGTSLALKALRRPGVPATLSYGQTARLLGGYLVPNMFAGLSLAAVLAASGVVEARALPSLVGTFALAWAAGYLAFLTPSGLGVREGALVVLLTPGYGLAAATVASLLSRVTLTVAEALTVGFWQVSGR